MSTNSSNVTTSTTSSTSQLTSTTAASDGTAAAPQHLSYLMALFAYLCEGINGGYSVENGSAKMANQAATIENNISQYWIDKINDYSQPVWDTLPESDQENWEILEDPNSSSAEQQAACTALFNSPESAPYMEAVQSDYNAHYPNKSLSSCATSEVNKMKSPPNDMSDGSNQTKVQGWQTDMQSYVNEADSTTQQMLNSANSASSDLNSEIQGFKQFDQALNYSAGLH